MCRFSPEGYKKRFSFPFPQHLFCRRCAFLPVVRKTLTVQKTAPKTDFSSVSLRRNSIPRYHSNWSVAIADPLIRLKQALRLYAAARGGLIGLSPFNSKLGSDWSYETPRTGSQRPPALCSGVFRPSSSQPLSCNYYTTPEEDCQ